MHLPLNNGENLESLDQPHFVHVSTNDQPRSVHH